MTVHAKEFKVEKMAQVLEVSRSGYYQYLNRGESKRTLENRVLLEEIRQIYKKNRRVYGSPRIHRALKQQGYHYSRKRVARLMQENHTDRGCQYTSKEFKQLTDHQGIKLSMSGKGCCYDNAVVESFFHSLKTEEIHLCKYRTREEAKSAIFEYVEVFLQS